MTYLTKEQAYDMCGGNQYTMDELDKLISLAIENNKTKFHYGNLDNNCKLKMILIALHNRGLITYDIDSNIVTLNVGLIERIQQSTGYNDDFD